MRTIKKYTLLEALSLFSMYCTLYSVAIADIDVPSHSSQMYGTKVQSVIHQIQLRWLNNATSREWSSEDFVRLCFGITEWIENSPETCDDGESWEYWYACQWKRAAQKILGLNVKGE